MGSSRLVISAWLLCITASAAVGRASAIAYDSAGDSAYNGASTYDGINGGYGWGGPWQADNTSFVGSSSENGDGDSAGTGDINSPRTPLGRAWGLHPSLYPGFENAVPAYRPLSGPLAVGQTVSLDFDNGSVPGDHLAWVALRIGPAGPWSYRGDVFSIGAFLEPTNPSGDYILGYAATRIDTGIPLTYRGVHISYSVLDSTTAILTISSYAAGGSIGSFTVPYAPIDGVGIYNDGDGPRPASAGEDVYFNDVSVTPEPTGGVLLVVPVCALLTIRMRSKAARL